MPSKKQNRASKEPDNYASYESLNLIQFKATWDLVRVYLWQTLKYHPHSFYAEKFRVLGDHIEAIDLIELKDRLYEDHIYLPSEFFAFSNTELLYLLEDHYTGSWIFTNDDPILPLLPYFFTDCREISYEQGGLLNMEHYCCGNHLAVYNFSGKRVSTFCHDLALCINGTFVYRALDPQEDMGYARYRPDMDQAETYDKLKVYSNYPYTSSFINKRDKLPHEVQQIITQEEKNLESREYDEEFAWRVIRKLEKNYKEKIWYTAPWFRKYFRNNFDFALWAVSKDYQAFPLLHSKLMRNKLLFNLFALSAPYDLVALTILEYDLDDSCLRSPLYITNWLTKSKYWQLSDFMYKGRISTGLLKLALFRNDFDDFIIKDFPESQVKQLSHLFREKDENLEEDDDTDLPF